MTTTTDTDLKELKDLILGLDKKITDVEKKLTEFDQKIDVQLTEIKGEIKAGFKEVEGKINVVEAKLDGLEKRLGNQEFISRSVFIGLLLTLLGGLAKMFFFDKTL